MDLPPPQPAIQAAHACIEVARALLSPDHPHLVLLGTESEQQLLRVQSRLQSLGIICKPFRDSDLGNELTAVATEPISGSRRRFFRQYRCLRAEDLCAKAVGIVAPPVTEC